VSSIYEQIDMGREKLVQGDFHGALALADAAFAADSISFDALQIRARALFLLGREEEARETLRRLFSMLCATDALPDDPNLSEVPTLMSGSLQMDETPLGREALDTLIALHARTNLDDELLTLLAELAEGAGSYELAREAFADLVERDPARLDAWEGMIHVLVHENLDTAALTIIRAQELFPAHPLFFEFQGFIHYRRRRYPQAITAYRQAIEVGADHPDTYESLVHCYLAIGDQTLALDFTRYLVRRWPNDFDAHLFAIKTAIECRQLDVAARFAYPLMRMQPTSAETYSFKAWVEIRQGDWEIAERTLRLGYHKAVDGAFALFELIDILIDTGSLDDALRVCELALELAPTHPETFASRGKVLREREQLPEALSAFRQAAALAPRDDAYQTWQGVVLDNMGEYIAAIQAYTQVLARHPQDVWTLTNRGLAYLGQGQIVEAQADFVRGLAIDPEDAALHFWHGCSLERQGKHREALKCLRRAQDLHDDVRQWLDQEPMLDTLRRDPRFRQFFQHSDGEATPS